MSWSYTGNPADSLKDEVRFLIGDTDTSEQQISDEEINYLIDSESTAIGSAIKACRNLMAKYARKFSQSVGKVRLEYDQLINHYKMLCETLEKQQSLSVRPYAGGISISDKETTSQDTDRVRPSFTRTLHNYEGYDERYARDESDGYED